MQNEIKNKIDSLTEQLIFHNRKYYIENNPIISDFEYDKLLKELTALENENPLLAREDSPARSVGNDILSGFKQVKHLRPMKSLENTYSNEDILEWYQKLIKIIPADKLEFAVELKIDGVAVSLVYENGNFKQALTRGDGEYGDAKTIKFENLR